MNLVGKIFVLLIFIMSLVFMSTAVMVYATHRNWKEESTRAKQNGWRRSRRAICWERTKKI